MDTLGSLQGPDLYPNMLIEYHIHKRDSYFLWFHNPVAFTRKAESTQHLTRVKGPHHNTTQLKYNPVGWVLKQKCNISDIKHKMLNDNGQEAWITEF